MKFSVKEVDINFEGLHIVASRGLQFRFTTDSFASMGVLAALKKNPNYINYLKTSMIDAILNMTDEQFNAFNQLIAQRVTPNTPMWRKEFCLFYANNSRDSKTVTFEDSMRHYFERPVKSKEELANLYSKYISIKNLTRK